MGAGAALILALGMAMDAFAASVVKGAQRCRSHWREIAATALLFGMVEMLTPLLGYAVGVAASRVVADWDHWIAFALLSLLGVRMLRSGLSDDSDEEADDADDGRFLVLLLTAVATSIDSMVAGVGLAFLDVNIVYMALLIGAATALMSALGQHLGRLFGAALGKKAEILGGVVLIGIGVSILSRHMGWWT